MSVTVFSKISGTDGLSIYDAPPPNGSNDTTALQTFLDTMSAQAVAEGKPRIVRFAEKQLYNIDGLLHPDYIVIDLNQSTLKKIANYSGSIFTSPSMAAIRAAWVKTGNSWYGTHRKMGLMNGYIDGNNKNYLAILDYLNVEDFFVKDVSITASVWSSNWSTRFGGRNVSITGLKIYGATRVYQDGLHFVFGENLTANDCYIESGDDTFAAGNDELNGGSGVYFDDQELKNFSVSNIRALSTRGYLAKIYCPASYPYGYTKALKTSNGYVQVVGKSGLLRNGGVGFSNAASANNRVLTNLMNVSVNAFGEVGTDGTAVYSAIAGTLVGSPTAVSKANPGVVTLNNHGLTNGSVVCFTNIPSTGMVQLVSFYKVKNVTTNTFELTANAYAGTSSLDTSSFATWTSGDLINCTCGTGYQVGEILTLAGGTYTEQATFRVVEVDSGTGVLRAVQPVNRGNYSVLPSSPNTPTGGSGTGATLYLETLHDGVNANGVNSYGSLNCGVTGTIKINDTTGAATRFNGLYLEDSQRFNFSVNLPYVPVNGGALLVNQASTLKTKDNIINSYMVGNASMSISYGFVTLSNTENTTVSGVFEEVPTNLFCVRPAFGGNLLEGKTVTAISAADPAVVTATAHGRKIGDYVTFSGNVLSAGDINTTIYRVVTVPTADTLTLESLSGNPLVIAPATVTTGGTLYLAPNTVTVSNLTVRQAAGTSGVSVLGTPVNSPYRWTSAKIQDSDIRGVFNGNIANSFAAASPIYRVSNVAGYSLENKEFRTTATATTVTHDALTTEVVVVKLGINTTIAAPTNARVGCKLRFTFIQVGGPFTITWNAVFKKAADGAALANQVGSIDFVYNGTNWVQQGGALTYL